LSKKKKEKKKSKFNSSFRLVINYRFVQRIASQMNALKQGFQEILSLETLKMFDEKEVEVKNTKKNSIFFFMLSSSSF